MNNIKSVYHGQQGLRTLKELGRSYLTISKQLWTYSGLGLETHDSAQYYVAEGQLQRSKKPPTVRGLNRDLATIKRSSLRRRKKPDQARAASPEQWLIGSSFVDFVLKKTRMEGFRNCIVFGKERIAGLLKGGQAMES